MPRARTTEILHNFYGTWKSPLKVQSEYEAQGLLLSIQVLDVNFLTTKRCHNSERELLENQHEKVICHEQRTVTTGSCVGPLTLFFFLGSSSIDYGKNRSLENTELGLFSMG